MQACVNYRRIINNISGTCCSGSAYDSGVKYACKRISDEIERELARHKNVNHLRLQENRGVAFDCKPPEMPARDFCWHEALREMPKQKGWYWVTYRTGEVGKSCFNGKTFSPIAGRVVYVVAWRHIEPLPEPYPYFQEINGIPVADKKVIEPTLF